MIDLARVLGFTMEATHRDGIVCECLAHDLERALPLHPHMLGEEDLSHPPDADPLENVVAICHDRADEIVRRLLHY